MTTPASLTSDPFGITTSGQIVTRYHLTNPHGLRASFTNFGATLLTLHTPDRHGQLADITLGFDALAAYEIDESYQGTIAGRFANRINHGQFSLDGKSYSLATNDADHHLHGGNFGFNRQIWETEELPDESSPGLRFSRVSPDGEEGYPGALAVSVTYRLTADNTLDLEYTATTNAPTILNLTNHTYFNLAGSGPILDHVARIAADRFVETRRDLIPTGQLPEVRDTPLDFRTPHRIGDRIDSDFPAIVVAGGYDHCFLIEGSGYRPAATITEPTTGRRIDVTTDAPGLQFYSGNHLTGTPGKNGHPNAYRTGLCLEAGHFPDSPNHSHFPTTILRPREVYRQHTSYRFSAERNI